jgi:hypothetical protein
MGKKDDGIEHGEFIADKSEYVPMTDEEVNDLAKQVYRNEVFTSWMHMRAHEHDTLVPMVFMPLMFIDEITRKHMVRDQLFCYYENWREAGPRGINGMPIFMSMQSCTPDDAKRVADKVKEIEQLLGDNKPGKD